SRSKLETSRGHYSVTLLAERVTRPRHVVGAVRHRPDRPGVGGPQRRPPVITSATPAPSIDDLHTAFLPLLPRVELHGRVYFRGLKCPDTRADRIAEMVALAWRWFLRLIELGKNPLEFPTAIADFAARAVKAGRRLCGKHKGKDVLNPLAQQRYD